MTTAQQSRDVAVYPSAESVARVAADRFVARAVDAIAAHGKFVVALSGGATPKRTYELLSADARMTRERWQHVHVVFGDERCVPPDDPASNYRMARMSLLGRVPIPPAQVHRIAGEDEPKTAAALYEATLRALLRTPVGPPRAVDGARIDLVLLGLGEDGHTASIFPGSAAVADPARWVTAALASAAPSWRVTLSAAVINAAAEVLFLVAGASKATIVRRVLAPDAPRDPLMLPAQAIAPVNGWAHWYLDQAAAGGLGPSQRPHAGAPAAPGGAA